MENFSFTYRNPGHWDIHNFQGRIFCIRGEPDKTYIRDERGKGDNNNSPAGMIFKDAFLAAEWIIAELMLEDDK